MGQVAPSCCGTKCGQPTIVSIGEEVRPPLSHPGPDKDPGVGASDAVPAWLSDLAPHINGDEVERAADAWARCGEELQRRTRQFVRRAICGVPCWFIDQAAGCTVPASYSIDEQLESFIVETAVPLEAASLSAQNHLKQDTPSRHVTRMCQLADIRNVWICADGELARRVHGTLKHGCDADLATVMLIDAPTGPMGLVERSTEAREEFLDCMAVLVSVQRLRSDPEIACCRHSKGAPPPEARLRPFGKSLQSAHISGPMCVWLAQAAEGLLPRSQHKKSRDVKEDPGEEPSGTDVGQHPDVCANQASDDGKINAILVDIDAPLPEGLLQAQGPLPAPKKKGSKRPAEQSAADASSPADVEKAQQPMPNLEKKEEVNALKGGKWSCANGNPAVNTTAGTWDASPTSPSVKEPPPSDGVPLMMGNWVGDQPEFFDPTVLSKSADKDYVLPPEAETQCPHAL